MTDETKEMSVDQDIHFTYKEKPDMESLCQGDVLEKTDALNELLGTVHPYFQNDDYQYFMILTQSCDLVRRDGKKCKTPYITLAAVRSYTDFLEKTLVANGMAELYNGFLLVDQKGKTRVSQLVERIYNNTEPDYFFLYKEDVLGFPKSMVAYLKVSIALKSELHYQTCLDAKRLELSDEFKAKLGWLVGNMYSRVGTTDWESKMTDKARKQMIEDDINSRCVIGTKEQLKKLKVELAQNADALNTHDQAIEYLSTIIVQSKYDQVMAEIEQVFKQAPKSVREEDRQFLLRAIKSRSKIQSLVQ